ncbi:MAG: sugar transferase, partial [Acidimicrobiia bacterium]|nr:sugar transferase [Acidimicrobiia bacterium]
TRLEVPPGLTGLWQVKGRNETTFDERLRLDIEYVRTMSLWVDLKILFLTVFSVIRRSGA